MKKIRLTETRLRQIIREELLYEKVVNAVSPKEIAKSIVQTYQDVAKEISGHEYKDIRALAIQEPEKIRSILNYRLGSTSLSVDDVKKTFKQALTSAIDERQPKQPENKSSLRSLLSRLTGK